MAGKAVRAGINAIANNPLKAVDAALNLLGIGKPSTAEKRHASFVDLHRQIRNGDYQGLVRSATTSKWIGARWEAAWALLNGSRDANAAEAARQAAGVPRAEHPSQGWMELANEIASTIPKRNPWASSNSPAPTGAGPSSPSAPTAPPSSSGSSSAPSAPKPPKQCAYGERIDGRCPPKPKKTPTSPGTTSSGLLAGATPKKKKDCKYGARDEDGLCPKKPSTYSSSGGRKKMTAAEKKISKAQSAALRRAENAVVGGLTRGGKALVKAAGGIGPAAMMLGQVALVGAAGYVAYRVTAKLLTLRYKTWAELRKDVADEYRHARQELAGMTATYEGRALTDAELRNTALWYKGADARLKALQAEGVPISDVSSVIFSED